MKSTLTIKKKIKIGLSFLALLVSICILSVMPCFGSISKDKCAMKPEATSGNKHQIVRESGNKVMFSNGRLTVNFSNESLEDIMEEINYATGISVEWQSPDTGKVISAAFADLPLDEAVQNLLQGENYVVFYNSYNGHSELNRIIILPDKNDDIVVKSKKVLNSGNHSQPLLSPPPLAPWIGRKDNLEVSEDEIRQFSEDIKAFLMQIPEDEIRRQNEMYMTLLEENGGQLTEDFIQINSFIFPNIQ